MSKQLLIIVCNIAIVLATTAQAQQAVTLSIDALASNVVANNPERRFYVEQIGLAGIERDASNRLPDPEMSVEFGERRTADGITGMPTGKGPTYGVSIMQPLDFAGRGALREAIAGHQIALARIGLAQFDATLASRARSLGYAWFVAGQKAAAARDVAARMRRLAQVMEQRDPAGPAPMLDVAILEAGAMTSERNATAADVQANVMIYELNQLRSAPLDARIRINPPDVPLPGLPPVVRLAQDVDAHNFELQSLRAQSQQQRLRVDLAQKSRLPSVAVGPYYNHAKSDIRETNFGIRLSTTLPLWNSQAVGVAQEQSRQSQSNTALLAAKRRVARQVYEQAALYEAKRRTLAGWSASAIDKFAAAATAAENNFRQGAIPVATYVEMQRQYLDALSAMLDTKREALDALLVLRALNGGRSLLGDTTHGLGGTTQ
ncbi:TolC family protein [Bradyrhizobium sp. G127]|uniref:TolC family protein n=1 Tax=Bradyrhizobium sp. G127 TaxID=2904800 RepID=UPI001F1584F1|nr:TolC family protein [Bradyrhizobium sp. G127]MCF2521700.1 TolC family protein [Bradyrhizobium sp. G127]